MKSFSQLFGKKAHIHDENHKDTIKSEASSHREVVNSSMSQIRNTDCDKNRRKHIQIVKERLSSIHQITQKYPFITVSVDAISKIEAEIHKHEAEIHMREREGRSSLPNPQEIIQMIKQYKSTGNFTEASKLLMHCISTSEEASVPGIGVSPWYYEQLAEIFRHEKEYAKEVSIIERYLKRDRSPSAGRSKLYKRLDEARRLQGTFGNRGPQ